MHEFIHRGLADAAGHHRRQADTAASRTTGTRGQGKTYLLFRAEDAPSLVKAFDDVPAVTPPRRRPGRTAAEFARARSAHGTWARTARTAIMRGPARTKARRQGRDGQGRCARTPTRFPIGRTFNRERAQGR
ncbi:MAG: hypothetical protein ACLTMP_09375 [Eggerthella lenta]